MNPTMKTYQANCEELEKPFLEVSSSFYCSLSQRLIESCSCAEYLTRAEHWLADETDHVAHSLDSRSEPKITSVVEKELIANQMQLLVHMENSGLIDMLVNDCYEDLSRMYSLFRRVQDGLPTIRDIMTSHIRKKG